VVTANQDPARRAKAATFFKKMSQLSHSTRPCNLVYWSYRSPVKVYWDYWHLQDSYSDYWHLPDNYSGYVHAKANYPDTLWLLAATEKNQKVPVQWISLRNYV
jgi:hypothetical protein